MIGLTATIGAFAAPQRVYDTGHGEDRSDGGHGVRRAHDDEVALDETLNDSWCRTGLGRACVLDADDLDQPFLADEVFLKG